MTEQAITVGEFRVGSVLGRSFSILFKNIVPFGLLSVLILAPTNLYEIFSAPAQPEAYSEELVFDWTALGVLAVEALLGYLLTAALVYGTVQDLRGRRVNLGDCIGRGFATMFAVLGVAIVSSIVIGVGTLLLIIPGVIAMTILWVAIPAAVIERNGLGALSRSSELTRGFRWKILFVLLLLIVIAMFAGALAGGIAGFAIAISSPGGDPALVTETTAFGLVMWITTALTHALMAVASAVGYHDLRVAKEGVDVEQIAAVFD